jgi:hypothetical protein
MNTEYRRSRRSDTGTGATAVKMPQWFFHELPNTDEWQGPSQRRTPAKSNALCKAEDSDAADLKAGQAGSLAPSVTVLSKWCNSLLL